MREALHTKTRVLIVRLDFKPISCLTTFSSHNLVFHFPSLSHILSISFHSLYIRMFCLHFSQPLFPHPIFTSACSVPISLRMFCGDGKRDQDGFAAHGFWVGPVARTATFLHGWELPGRIPGEPQPTAIEFNGIPVVLIACLL